MQESNDNTGKRQVTFRKLQGYHKPVFPIGLGCLQLTQKPPAIGDPERLEDQNVLIQAYENGVNLFDSADIYGHKFGANESLLGKAFKKLALRHSGFREKVIVTTKGGIEGFKNNLPVINNNPKYLKKACDASLKRLGIDYIDLYYLHRHDNTTPIETIIDVMAELVKEGKIKLIGLSEVNPLLIAKAHQYAREKHGLSIAAVQPEYSLASREIEETGVFDLCKKLKIAIIPYGSISRGILTDETVLEIHMGTYKSMLPRFSKTNLGAELKKRDTAKSIASQQNCSLEQLSLRWLLHKYENLIPIPGTTKIKHLTKNIESIHVDIDETAFNKLSASYPVGTFSSRYPEGFTEVTDDKIWTKKYSKIKQKVEMKKVRMNDVTNVVFELIKKPDLQKQPSLQELIKGKTCEKLKKAMLTRNSAQFHDGILSSSAAILGCGVDKPTTSTFGKHKLSESSSDISEESIFNLSSVSKHLIMIMVMRLVQTGVLALDNPISKYLTDTDAIPGAAGITISHLLNHHSGLRDKKLEKYLKNDPIQRILQDQLSSEPGNLFYYCRAGYVILSKIIEAATQDTLDNQLDALIVKPLDLKNTYATNSENEKDPRVAVGYKYTRQFQLFDPNNDFYMWGSNGFRSTPSDLVVISKNFFENNSFISEELRSVVTSSCKEVTFKVATKTNTYQWPAIMGLGITKYLLDDVPGHDKPVELYGHGGWQDGSAVILLYAPALKSSYCYACTKTQGAHKINLHTLTEGIFVKPAKNIDNNQGEPAISSNHFYT